MLQTFTSNMCFWRLLLLLSVCFTLSAEALAEETVKIEGGPPGVVWVVQVSDIHISKWKPERGRTLRRSLGRALKLINPALVLISGDLTDAKVKAKTSSAQYEDEWREYQSSIHKAVEESGIAIHRFSDLRGNHDRYGVPPESNLDYFTRYSISAALNRTSLVQSVTVEGNDGHRHVFVGFDDSMVDGLRGPSNTFGHPTDDVLQELDRELRRAENATKVVYGHYPMSFTTSTDTGKRPEEVMAKNGVTAYLCGHLHAKFGRQLYKRHIVASEEFWEWEVGDWRSCRLLRVLAIDNGHTSFVDVALMSPSDHSTGEYTMPTFVLQTYPLDSRFMLPRSGNSETSSSIRAIVFSESQPVSVTASIYDSTMKLASRTSMKLFEGAGPYYYTASWEPEKYRHGKYRMQITVDGSCHSEMRDFSVEGEAGEFRLTGWGFILFGLRWEVAFPVLLWSMMVFLLAILLVPKLFLYHLHYEDWVVSVFTPGNALGKVIKVPFWVMVEGVRNSSLWAGMLTYVLSLIVFPWFWGRILGDDYPLGHMSIRGWTVNSGKRLAVPDIMGIVLPYVYGVVFPLLLILSALSAEKAACEFHITSLAKWQKKADDVSSLSEIPGSIKEEIQTHERREDKHDRCRLCDRFIRRGLFLGCFGIAYNHWRFCSTMVGAYGPMVLVAGPAYAWGVPALLMFTLSQTSKISGGERRHFHSKARC